MKHLEEGNGGRLVYLQVCDDTGQVIFQIEAPNVFRWRRGEELRVIETDKELVEAMRTIVAAWLLL